MTRADLLRCLAQRLYVEATMHVPNVLAGQDAGVPEHLAGFIRAQRPLSARGFQLPEPLLGPIPAAVEVVVIGLNPGYGPTEDIPTTSATLDEYVAWYAHRMDRRDDRGQPCSLYDGKPGVVRHYAAVERDYLGAVLGERALGRAAVYADAIPWKWNRDAKPSLANPQIGTEARERVGSIAQALQPRVLLTLGQEVAGLLLTPWPNAAPDVTSTSVGGWSGSCIAMWHPNHRWASGEKSPYFARAHSAVVEALSRTGG